MKRLVHQVLVGDVKSLWRTCVESMAVYCRRHGLTHFVQTEPVLRIFPRNSARSANALRLGYLPIFEKWTAFMALADYDEVASIDADVYAQPSAPNLFEDIPPDAEYASVTERRMPITPAYARKLDGYSKAQYGDPQFPFWNCGVEVLRRPLTRILRGQPLVDVIHRPEFAKYVNGEGALRFQTEQTLRNDWFRAEQVNRHELDWTNNGLYGAVLPNRIDEAFLVHFFLSDHLSGDDPQEMLRTGNARARV